VKTSVATITLSGITPLSQSRQHDEPKLDGESHGDYDIRTWRYKLNTSNDHVVIPAHGLMQCLTAAAKYSKRQIPGQGKATWTAKFAAGVAILEDPQTDVIASAVQSITISANADGVRGSGKRVPRRFPIMPQWGTTFDLYILDPIITQDVLREMLDIAGMFVGVGRFRPEKGGTNGRFKIAALNWQDNRQIAA
jgi:hypothetical protein